MSSDMQEQLPLDPPPPPVDPAGAAYGHWAPDPHWGPPAWPPAAPARSHSRFMQRTLIAGLAIVCVGAGGGTAWAITSATLTRTPTTASLPSGSSQTGEAPNSTGDNGTGATAPSSGGTASSAAIAAIDAATVDINAITAAHTGEVAGTGMIITSSGLVLTNNHVIDNTEDITALIDGTGTPYKVTVIGYDASDDVALVQLVGASGLPTVPIGNSDNVNIGASVTVIGNALGKGGTPAVVTGVVSQLDQQITASDDSDDTESLTGMLQVQADIEPGNSGGPEINAAGQVIGMTTAGSTSGNPNQETGATTGFAIPINKAMQIIAEIRAGSGTNVHIGNAAELGIEVAQPSATQTLPGAYVSSILAGTPAVGLGIASGDRIVKIDSQTIASSNDLHKAMEGYSNGQTVSLTWVDPSGTSHTGSLTLGLAPWPD